MDSAGDLSAVVDPSNSQGEAGVAAMATPPVDTLQNNATFVETSVGHMASRAGFLALFIIVAFIGNSMILATIVQSRRLRITVLNLLIINMSVVNLLQCVCNLPLILGSTITETWDYGSAVCQLNAFLMTMFSIVTMLGLTIMAIDRYLAVLDPEKYAVRVTVTRINYIIPFTWIQSAAFSMPLVINADSSAVFPYRYHCSLAESSSLLYIALTSIFCYIIPLAIIVIFYICIIKTGIKTKLRQRQALTSSHITEEMMPSPALMVQLHTSIYVGLLFIFWCALEGPYLTLSYIEQYRNSKEIQENDSLYIKFEYPWELDMGFTWIKLSYPTVLPFITFIWRKDIWQKLKNFILCRKSNVINDASPNDDIEEEVDRDEGDKRKVIYKEENHKSYQVPVLFATANGLHIQTYDHDSEDTLSDTGYFYADMTSKSNDIKVLKSRKCDVNGSQDMHADTSDYDSNNDDMEPFKSSKQKQVFSKTAVPRLFIESSDSDRPVISSPDGQKRTSPRNIVSDSGVDTLSDSNKGKKIRKKSSEEKIENIVTDDIKDSKEEEGDNDENRDSGRGTGKRSNKVRGQLQDINDQYHAKRDNRNLPNQVSDATSTQIGDAIKDSDNHAATIADSNETTESLKNETPTKGKVKKKKRSKGQSSNNVELSNLKDKNVQDSIEVEKDIDNKAHKRPPARLKPLDHKVHRSDVESDIISMKVPLSHVNDAQDNTLISAQPQSPKPVKSAQSKHKRSVSKTESFEAGSDTVELKQKRPHRRHRSGSEPESPREKDKERRHKAAVDESPRSREHRRQKSGSGPESQRDKDNLKVKDSDKDSKVKDNAKDVNKLGESRSRSGSATRLKKKTRTESTQELLLDTSPR
ncbi:unnamed protein product [Owenia fusiformis]|uniref:Uncharacterized protein n=1 Tax=Owenia fusiformis TaxID=6347 RepID=A0A8J1T6P1_OWEFU|nr:unnamed protein product [Owenia fusiformis]